MTPPGALPWPTSFPLRDKVNPEDTTEADLEHLVQAVEEQARRCDRERETYLQLLKFPAAVLTLTALVGLGCLFYFTTWTWWYLLVIYFGVALAAAPSALLFGWYPLTDTWLPVAKRLRAEERTLSEFLELVREIGPALAHEKKISPLKWAVIRIQLSRYGI